MGGICRDPITKKIIEFLQAEGKASTRRIARELKKPYSVIYNTLSRMYLHGIVDCRVEVERYPHGVGWLKVRYWWLKQKGRKDESKS